MLELFFSVSQGRSCMRECASDIAFDGFHFGISGFPDLDEIAVPGEDGLAIQLFRSGCDLNKQGMGCHNWPNKLFEQRLSSQILNQNLSTFDACAIVKNEPDASPPSLLGAFRSPNCFQRIQYDGVRKCRHADVILRGAHLLQKALPVRLVRHETHRKQNRRYGADGLNPACPSARVKFLLLSPDCQESNGQPRDDSSDKQRVLKTSQHK